MALCPCPCTTVGRLAPIPRPRERFEASSGAARVCGQQFFMRPGSPSCPAPPSRPAPSVAFLPAAFPQPPFSQPSFPQSPSHFMKKPGHPRPHSQPTAQFLHKPERQHLTAAQLPQPSFSQPPSHFMKKLDRPRLNSRPAAQFLHKPERQHPRAANRNSSTSVLRTGRHRLSVAPPPNPHRLHRRVRGPCLGRRPQRQRPCR